MWNMERIGFTASEEKSFENVDGWTDDRRTDICLYYKLTSMSLQLRWAKKKKKKNHFLPTLKTVRRVTANKFFFKDGPRLSMNSIG